MEFKTYMCLICGWVYDEAVGVPEEGISPGTLWADIPINWTCPECGARKEDFEMMAI
jgi:rubredoxin